jgi:ankyrin repeat protein
MLQVSHLPESTESITNSPFLNLFLGEDEIEILNFLEKSNNNINHTDDDGNTILMKILGKNCFKLLKSNEKDLVGKTRQEIVDIRTKNYEEQQQIAERLALKILERENVVVNNVDADDCTPLILACFARMSDTALKLLENEDLNINQIGGNYWTALANACANKLESVALKILERYDVNVNTVDYDEDEFRKTPLIYAIINGLETVALKILDRKDVDLNIQIDDKTALIYALECGSETIALKILDKQEIEYSVIKKVLKIAFEKNLDQVIDKVLKRN